MKLFLLDLWHDLRAKRLWPVAAVLAAAVVAVPVVLSKSSEAPPPTPVESARTAPDPKDLKALASVKLDEAALERGSSLDTFDPSDPFRPPKAVTKSSSEGSGAPSTVTGGDTSSTAGADTGSTGGADTGSTGGDTGFIGGGDTGSTGGGTGTTGGGGTGTGTTTTTQYRYVVDATFSVNGRKRHINGLERLDMLPNEASPLLLFLGVTPSAGNAVFLVDSTLDAAGEGTCKPRARECAFLYIGAGSEHEFTNDDGDSYTLRIDEIRKVRVGGSAAAASREQRSARAAVGRPTAARRFASPLISDLVTVSSGGDADSTDHQARR
jgi:hypothetical protein